MVSRRTQVAKNSYNDIMVYSVKGFAKIYKAGKDCSRVLGRAIKLPVDKVK